MVDDNNPVNKTNQPTTPQIQSTTQPRTRRSSRLGDDPLTDSVRNLISQFDASGARRPEELDQIEQAINESQRILTRAYSSITGRQPTELPLPQVTRPRTRHSVPIVGEQQLPLSPIPDLQVQQPLIEVNHPSSSAAPHLSGGSG